jgi:predicted XRE-type DNA-binding protein
MKRPSTAPNVFEALGYPPDQAQHLLIRSQLLAALQRLLRKKGLSQARMAKLLAITQPRVSNLMAGRIDLFSTDALIELLARLGIGVRLTLGPLPKKRPAA